MLAEMKILPRTFLIIFSITLFTCRQEKPAASNQSVSIVPDSVLLHQADLLYNLAEAITDLKKSDSVLSLHKRALAIREKLLTNDLRLVESYYKVGVLYNLSNKYDVANKYLENARRIAEAINTPILIIYGIYTNLIICKRELKDIPTATSIAQKLLHLIHERDPQNKAMIADAHDRLAGIYHYSNEEDKAIENWLISVKITPSSNHEILGKLYFNISIAYSRLKQFKKSLAYLNKSIQQDLIWAGPESKSIAD